MDASSPSLHITAPPHYSTPHTSLHTLTASLRHQATCLHRFIVINVSPFWLHLSYFLTISTTGFLALKFLPMRHRCPDVPPKNLDMFFTSVSSVTVSSMSVIEMEAFSTSQLLLITILMLVGGEVFISMLSLPFHKSKSKESTNGPSSRYLALVVLSYQVLAHVTGVTLLAVYLAVDQGAKLTLRVKGLNMLIFSLFTTVSSFTNCGYIPTNENMVVFRKCPWLLLVVMALVLSGNTLYPLCLRVFIWVLKRVTKKREFDSMLKDGGELGYDDHLLPRWRCLMLGLTVAGFVLVQFVLFCGLQWRMEGLAGMSTYEKIIGAMFMSVNSRHAGESIVDLSTVSPAVLITYVVMMYLPPYTSFNPIQDHNAKFGERFSYDGNKKKSFVRTLIFSQVSYLAIFIIIICITERRQLIEDPLNFNVLNIVLEVVSAYGNVGYSVGYSCNRRQKLDRHCEDVWYGFSGRWSDGGKLVLIVVMFFGRLKKFSMTGGQAWVLA